MGSTGEVTGRELSDGLKISTYLSKGTASLSHLPCLAMESNVEGTTLLQCIHFTSSSTLKLQPMIWAPEEMLTAP